MSKIDPLIMPTITLQAKKKIINGKVDIFRNLIKLPVMSRYPTIECFQWVKNKSGEYTLELQDFTIEKLFDNALNTSEPWYHFLLNLYKLYLNNNIKVNKLYDKEYINSALVFLIIFIIINKSNNKSYNKSNNKGNNKVSLRKKNLENQNSILKTLKNINQNKSGVYSDIVYFILSFSSFIKLYTAFGLYVIKSITDFSENNNSNSSYISITIKLILEKLQNTFIYVKGTKTKILDVRLEYIIDNNNNNLGDCLYLLLIIGRCLSLLMIGCLGYSNNGPKECECVLNNNLFNDLINENYMGQTIETILIAELIDSPNGNQIFSILKSKDVNEKVLSIFEKIIYIYSLYWSVYNTFIDKREIQYTNRYIMYNNRISQKMVLEILKENSYIKRKFSDYSLISKLRKISKWQEFSSNQLEILGIKFFNQIILYFVKEDRGYSLLFMLVIEEIKKQIDNGEKLIISASKLGITGSTEKLYLIQPQFSMLKQLHLSSILDHHKNITKENVKQNAITQMAIDKIVLSDLISIHLNNERNNQQKDKWGYLMEIESNTIVIKIINPDIFGISTKNINSAISNTANNKNNNSTNNNSKSSKNKNVYKYFILKEHLKKNKNEDKNKNQDKNGKKKMFVILDNGFIVLVQNVKVNSYMVLLVYGQLVKTEKNKYKLYKPYVPFDLEKDDDNGNYKDHNIEICEYIIDNDQCNIKFTCFLPFDFEIGNLLLRCLFNNLGISVGSKNFTKNFSETPNIIHWSNDVMISEIFDLYSE